MEWTLNLEGLSLAIRAAAVMPVEGGYWLNGEQVALLHPFGETRFYKHGWQSWSPTGWTSLRTPLVLPEPPEHRPQIDDPAWMGSPFHGGSWVGALEGPDGRVLLLGALDLGARVEADRDFIRGFYEEAPGAGEHDHDHEHEPAVLSGNPQGWFLTYGEETVVFERYAAKLAECFGRRGDGAAPRVWCSWYSAYTGITEAMLVRTLDGVKGLPFDVFQIDDGWQQDMGDWEANEKFPEGMAALATRIREAGFTPGLWLAPLIVRPTARLFREHPEWLLRDEKGELVLAGHNWGDFYYALDTTLPEVQSWLAALIRQVVGWGYTYLKLDFLYAGALPGVRSETVRREEAYRQALTLIRREMGLDTYLLACGAVILPTLGLAEAMRIGPDVAPFWDNEDRSFYLHDISCPSALNALRASLHRLWLRSLVHTDPDVAYFRTRYNLLSPEQMQAIQDLALVSGFKATSDLPYWMDPAEREALKAFLEFNPLVERKGRFHFTIDGRDVHFDQFKGLIL